MTVTGSAAGRLWAISDLHVAYPENRSIVEGLRPSSDDDWLLVAGDVGELFADVEWVLRLLSDRFAVVVWVPGNHELWTHRDDPVQLRGEERYRSLVQLCRSIGVHTPEDPYPIWPGPDGPAVVVPLFLLYDYTFQWDQPHRDQPLSRDHPHRWDGPKSRHEALVRAEAAGIMPTDEILLHPDPYPSREAWCRARLASTEERLVALGNELPTVLVNHFPLTRDPTQVLYYPQFAPWCGTEGSADWHRRFGAVAVVYGHLHIPRTTWLDGVPFVEVSLGYPREWRSRPSGPQLARQILPLTGALVNRV